MAMNGSPDVLTETASTNDQKSRSNETESTKTEALKARHAVTMDRQDSGFGEVLKSGLNMLDIQQGPQPNITAPTRPSYSPTRHDMRLSEEVPARRTPIQKAVRPPSNREPIVEMSVQSRRAGSDPFRSSHGSTTPATSLRSSNTSRKSSVMSGNRKSHPVARRSFSVGYGSACSENAFDLHRRSVQLFSPFTSILDPPPTSSPDFERDPSPTITVSLTSSEHQTTSEYLVDGTTSETPADPPHQYENFVPATPLDWTLPSTRQREYRKIDRSCRGLRRFWRRLVPRWCHRKSNRLGFFQEDEKSDVGSVRRYRLDVGNEEPTGEKGQNGDAPEPKPKPLPNQACRPWNHSVMTRSKTYPAWRGPTTTTTREEGQGLGEGQGKRERRMYISSSGGISHRRNSSSSHSRSGS